MDGPISQDLSMSDFPHCPRCGSSLSYHDGTLFVCPECGHEWSGESETEAEAVEADDIVDILDSSFKIANVAYTLMWRHSLMLEAMEGKSNDT